MAQWYKVYWQSSTGQQKTTMTSNPNRAQRKIMGTGGRVYKVVQPYAGRRYPKAEKPIAKREPIPTKTKSPLSKKESLKESTPTQPGKTYPSGIVARYRGMDKKKDLGFDKKPDFQQQPDKPMSFFDIEKKAGRKAGLDYHHGTDILEEKRKVYVDERTPSDPMQWQKTVLKKTERYPPIVQQVQEFQIGLRNVLTSITDVAISPFFTGKERKKQSLLLSGHLLGREHLSWITESTHFVTPFDFALEPIGLAPKGSTELMMKYPAFTVGGAVGEVAQFYLFGQAMKGMLKGLVEGTKAIVRKTPHVFYKVTKELGLPKVAQKIAYQSEVQHIWQNLYSYSKGEAGFLKVYPMAKGYPKVIKLGKERVYTGFGHRELFPINVVKHAKARMGTASDITIRHSDLGSQIIWDVETIKVKGRFFKTITESYESIGTKAWTGDIGSSGGLVKGFTKETTASFAIGKTPSGAYFRDLKNFIQVGTKKDPIPWILRKDIAQQTLLPPVQMPHVSGISHMGKVSLPIIKIAPESVSTLATKGMVGLGLGRITFQLLDTDMRLGSITTRKPKMDLKSIQRVDYKLKQDTDTLMRLDLSQKQKMAQEQKTKLILIPDIKLDISTTHRMPAKTITTFIPVPIPKIPWLPDGDKRTRRKKKPFMDIAPIKLSHHERVHPMRDIEKQLNIKGFTKSFSTDINKEMKKIMKGVM